MSEVKQIGNYRQGGAWDNPQTGRVYSPDGLAPTLNTCGGGGHEVKTVEPVYGIYTGVSEDFQSGPPKNVSRCLKANNHDASVIYQEPVIVASRGRNPQNPSDRTPGNYVEQRLEPNCEGICNTLTSVQKDNLLLEPAILTPKRTEYGKSIRKAYESGEVQESRHNMTELQPRSDGICNTLTTVQKDNLLLEPTAKKAVYIKCKRDGTAVSSYRDNEPTVKIKQATRQGYTECKLGGVADLSYPNSKTRRGRVQDGGDTCPTLTATETGICRIETPYRIRKLTPLECWRLMDFTDEDFEKAEKVNSNTQLYKQAGNSIVKAVLMAIFKQMIPRR